MNVVIVMVFTLSACDNQDEFLGNYDYNVLSSAERSLKSSSNAISILYMVDLSSYSHLQQQSIPGVRLTCGQTSYLVARRIANSSFSKPTVENVKNLDKLLAKHFSGSYGKTRIPKVYHLEWFAKNYDGFASEIFQVEERPKSGSGSNVVINYNGSGRQSFKDFIENKLSEGRPVIVPTTFKFGTSGTGHFLIVVGLRDNNGSLEIGYKDVYYSSNETYWVSYTKFLNGNWYNQAEWKTVSSGEYYTSTYIGYSL